MNFDWFPDWSRDVAVVIGGGPSAKDAGVDQAQGRAKVMVVNEAYRLAPWADVLYASDCPWWQQKRGVREFNGLRVSQSDQAAKMYPGIRQVRLVRTGQICRNPKGLLAAGSDEFGKGASSGFQALNLAVQFGAKRIVLVGYDMTLSHGVHWHGVHKGPLGNPTEAGTARWRAVLDKQAAFFEAIGVSVVNASPISALTNYPKMSLEQALGSG